MTPAGFDDGPCPCGTGRAFPRCCGRFHAGAAALTAEVLMRSRYAAYVRADAAYLIRTHAEAGRAALDLADLRAYASATYWLGLEIVAITEGGEADATGTVEFIARGITAGEPFAQRERSRFAREEGAWVYVDGDLRPCAAPAIGRNDACPCGNGSKFKRCHGRR